MLKRPREDVVKMARALVDVKDRITNCSVCCNITEADPCTICTSAKRERTTMCVVEEPSDVIALELAGISLA